MLPPGDFLRLAVLLLGFLVSYTTRHSIMDERADNGEKKQNQKKGAVDLSALQDFDFSGNWSESTKISEGSRERREGGPRGAGRDRRERRPDRRPHPSGGGRDEGARPRGTRPDRRERSGGPGQGDHRPHRRPHGEGGQHRRDAGGEGTHGRPRAHGRSRQAPLEQIFDISIFPEEPVIVKLTRAMRHSLRTFELFEIARLVLEKPDRFHFTMRHKTGSKSDENSPLLYQSVPDQLPFLTEEAAVDHVLRNHLETFFRTEEVEVEPPKGNFQFISRCTLTGDLLGPPNYHRYQSFLANYHQKRFPHMSFDRFRASVETIKDDEAVAEWLKSMTREVRYHPLETAGDNPPVLHSPDQARHYLLEKSKDKVVRSSKNLRLPGTLLEGIADKGIKPYLLDYVEGQKRFPLETANNLRGRLRRQNFFIYKRGSHGISYVCSVKRKFREPGQRFSDTVQSLIQFLENNDSIHASELPEKFLGIKLPQPPPSAVKRGEARQEGDAAVVEPGTEEPSVSGGEMPGSTKEEGKGDSAVESTAQRESPDPVAENVNPSPDSSGEEKPEPPVPEAAVEEKSEPTAAESEPENPLAKLDPADQEKLRRMTLDLRWLLTEGYVTEFTDGRLQVHPETAPAGRPDPVAEGGAADSAGPKSTKEPKPAEEQKPAEEPKPADEQKSSDVISEEEKISEITVADDSSTPGKREEPAEKSPVEEKPPASTPEKASASNEAGGSETGPENAPASKEMPDELSTGADPARKTEKKD